MRGPQVEAWEAKLRAVFNEIDDYLEEKYGGKYPLHPARPPRGVTANKEHDGLFNVGASYSAGFGSEYGAGYVIEVRMVTLTRIPYYLRARIEEEVVELLQQKLPRRFPKRKLKVARDGGVYKIYGDLGLDLP